MHKIHLKKMVYIVALASISIVLALFEIPWFIPSGPFAAFLRLDFSEVAILVSIVTLGYKDTSMVIVLRSLVRLTYKGFPVDEAIGEFIAFSASFSIMLGFYLTRKLLKKPLVPLFIEVPAMHEKLHAKLIALYAVVISLTLSVLMIGVNYVVTTPLLLSFYGLFSTQLHLSVFTFIPDSETFNFGSFLIAVIISYTPFNIVKALSVTLIFSTIWPRLKYIEY